MKEKIKTNKILVIMTIGLVLLFTNFVYTFSGFVTYTSEERRAVQLLDTLFETSPREAMEKKFEQLTYNDKEVISKYANQYKANNKRHKTIQQFYLEEGFILLLSMLVIFYTKKQN